MDDIAAAVVGFLAALVLPAVVIGVWTAVDLGEPVSAIVWSLLIYVFSIPLAGMFAAPAFFLGRRLRLIRWWSTIIVGLVIGAAVTFVANANFQLRATGIYACIGAAAGLVFWVVYERLRRHLESPSC